jgi:hypothetical protein
MLRSVFLFAEFKKRISSIYANRWFGNTSANRRTGSNTPAPPH